MISISYGTHTVNFHERAAPPELVTILEALDELQSKSVWIKKD